MQRLAVDFKGLRASGCLGRLNGCSGTGCDSKRKFAKLVDPLTVDHRRFAVNSQNRDVRAMNCAAHIEAASQRDSNRGRKIH